ncbi:DUF4148 domain-containing protein [Paraburkholderia sp. JHI869]|uniref:DUF4148 domain-containing protein n=1 Tax=Paraburkholderia sp. JHI869 TaxID=3112959 RepID=UPI00316CEF82
MKYLAQTVVVLTVIAAPVVAFAQTNGPVTREQVRSDLIQLEQAGYHVGDGDNANYPADIQAAEARVSAQNGGTSYGGVVSGTSQSGAPMATPGLQPVYFGQ